MAIDRHTLLSEWFSECEGSIEIRALPGGEREFFSIDDHQGIDAFVSKHSKKNIYFGIASRNGAGGTRANIVNIPGVWADIDFKNIPQEEVDKLLAECPLQPTFIINSGNGYHCYWKFREPTDNQEITEYINRQLAQYFDSDPVHDVTRVFRLPNTFNHKYSPKRPVKLIVHNQANQYNESDFEQHLPPLKHTTESGEPSTPPGWQDELLEGVDQGGRNNAATKLAGRCLAKGFSAEETFTYLRGWNQRNKPPLNDTELRGIVESISKTDARNHPPQEDPLQFPNVISGAAGEFAKLYSSYLEAPQHFLYMAFLTSLGIIMADKVRLASELNTQPRLYTILLGESADDRKSTAIEKTVDFFKEAIEGFSVCWGVGSAEGLQGRLKGAAKYPGKPAKLLMAVDELKTFVNKCKIDTSVLLTCTNSLFESNHYEANTKTAHVNINNAHLSILAASTVETYERIWTSNFIDIGFTNRLWLVPGGADRRFSIPNKIPEEKKKAIKEHLWKILKHVGEEGLELDFSQEARDVFHAWYMGLEQSIHTKRLDGYALRFMALLAINELRPLIDREIAEKVISLCNWQLGVRRKLDPIDADNTTARMEEKIRRHLTNGPLTERELKRKAHKMIKQSGSFVFTRAIGNLRRANEIALRKDGKTKKWYLAES